MYVQVSEFDEEALRASGNGSLRSVTCQPGQTMHYSVTVTAENSPFSGGRYQVKSSGSRTSPADKN